MPSSAAAVRRGQGVAHVEAPAERHLDALGPPAERASGRPEVQIRDVGERVRDGRDLGGVEQQPAVGIVDVDHRRAAKPGANRRALASK